MIGCLPTKTLLNSNCGPFLPVFVEAGPAKEIGCKQYIDLKVFSYGEFIGRKQGKIRSGFVVVRCVLLYLAVVKKESVHSSQGVTEC